MELSVIFLSCLVVAVVTQDIDWSSVRPRSIGIRIFGDLFDIRPTNRIVFGDIAKPHSIPYQAALRINVGNSSYFCGGSLISDRHILTAAHCTTGATNITVLLGAHNLKSSSESGRKSFIVPEERIHSHSGYNPSSFQNDIALLEISPPINNFTDAIQKISLPRERDVDVNYVDHIAQTSGWGRKTFGTGISEVLRIGKFKTLNWKACRNQLGLVTERHICWKGGFFKPNPCNGDSGGPLVIELDGVTRVFGVTSFGFPICELGFPVAFTNVASYLEWIKQITGTVFDP